MSTEHLLPPLEPNIEEQQAPDFHYELLIGHTRTDGTYKSTEQLQTEYVRLTDTLVHKIVDGVKVTSPETGETSKEKVDYVVWLDKSARPVSWLLRDLWPILAKDAEGNIPELPQSRFVNIDRNQWTNTIDPNGVGSSDVSKIDKSIVRSLRSIFLNNPKDRDYGLTDSIVLPPNSTARRYL